jgi:hypothetical protein
MENTEKAVPGNEEIDLDEPIRKKGFITSFRTGKLQELKEKTIKEVKLNSSFKPKR